jgi:hypothetical protein
MGEGQRGGDVMISLKKDFLSSMVLNLAFNITLVNLWVLK